MQKWEYLFLIRLYDKKTYIWFWEDDKDLKGGIATRLENLGQDGWELVSVTGLINPKERGLGFDQTTRLDFYFKRPIEE